MSKTLLRHQDLLTAIAATVPGRHVASIVHSARSLKDEKATEATAGEVDR